LQLHLPLATLAQVQTDLHRGALFLSLYLVIMSCSMYGGTARARRS
jgi:hypothetical protein